MPSTAIRRFSYDEETRTLFVTFVDGDLYAYRGVELQTYADMRAAFSKGRFFTRHVRGRYAYARLPPAGGDAPVLFTPA
jgi:KTSC domain